MKMQSLKFSLFFVAESYDDPTQQLVQVQSLKENYFCGTKREHVLLFARKLSLLMYIIQNIVLYHKTCIIETVGCSCVWAFEHRIDSLYIKCCTCIMSSDTKMVL